MKSTPRHPFMWPPLDESVAAGLEDACTRAAERAHDIWMGRGIADARRRRRGEPRLWVNQAMSAQAQIRAVFALELGLLGVTICEVSPIAIAVGLPVSSGLALGRKKWLSWPRFLWMWRRDRRSGIVSRWYGPRLPDVRIVSEHPHR